MPDDIVTAVLQRVSDACGMPDAALRAIETTLRHEWGGRRPYILKTDRVERLRSGDRTRGRPDSLTVP